MTPSIEETATYMRERLLESRLEVVLLKPCRCVTARNPRWYRDFCAAYRTRYFVKQNGKATKRKKRIRTYIKRCDTLKALARIADGKTHGVYAERLLDLIETYWDKYGQDL